MKRTPLRSDPDKLRAWKDRSRRENPLRSRTPIRPINRERRAKLHERNFGEYADLIRALPCDMCGSPGPNDPHHVRSRGAGGAKRHLIPGCRVCHRKLHDGHGPSREHLLERAAHYWQTYGEG